MNKTIVIVGGVIIVIAIIIGGVVYSKKNSVNISVVDNPVVDNPIIPTNIVIPQAGTPIVNTDAVVYLTDTTAIVKGSVNPKGVFTSYWYEYGVNDSLGTKTSNQVIGSGFITISAPGYIIGLTKNTTYFFRLVAENQYGKVAGSTYTFKTTLGTPAPIGGAPTVRTMTASSVSKTTAKLNGEVIPNKAGTEYWFEYGKTTELGDISTLTFVGDASVKTVVSFSLSGLNPETKYYFRLNAQNKFGTVNGSILNFKTLGPVSATAPSVVTNNATGVTRSKATLNGTINPNLAETKYWFEYSTANSSPLSDSTSLQSTGVFSIGVGDVKSSVNQTITELKQNTTYYFNLVAQNSIGTVRGAIKMFKTNK